MHVIHNPEGLEEEANLEKYIPTPKRFLVDFPSIPNLFPHCDPSIEFGIKTSVLEPVDAAYPMVVFPNPAKESTTINIDPAHEGLLSVIDMQGRILVQDFVEINTSQYKLDVAGWIPGLYVLRFESDKGVYIGKLMVE